MNNFDFIFLKAGEEWTTIAKTKGKKKTKPEDEWQEVDFFTPPMSDMVCGVVNRLKEGYGFSQLMYSFYLNSLLGHYGLCFMFGPSAVYTYAGSGTWD